MNRKEKLRFTEEFIKAIASGAAELQMAVRNYGIIR
jgi:hypothetical protein